MAVTFTYERKFGTQGSGDGQFQDPHDISFDSSGNVFVCDRVRNDVQKFTNGGTFISKFGSAGSGNGQFDVPYAIQHSPSGDIYVADRENNRIQRLNSSGTWISNITTVNSITLNKPEDISFDVTNGDMYILDTGNNRCVKLDSAHAFIRQWGSFGPGNGQFDHPHSINVTSGRNVLISCGNQPYIQKFSKDGVFIKKWGTEGTGNGQTQMFLEHMDIDVFQRVHLINNDSRPIINVWDTNGLYITKYGTTTKGSANGQFSEPEHVTCDPSNGKPFVVDSGNFRIQVFSTSDTGTPTPPGTPSNIPAVDLGMFLTGGSSNTDPNLSIGGNVSSTEITSDNLNNLFRRITESEAGSGITIYRCVALKNKNATQNMINAVFYMVFDTTSVDDLALYSKAQAAKNVVETAVTNEFTAPTGSNISFIAALRRSSGLVLGNLAPTEYINVWMRVSVNPGAKQFTENKFKMRLEVNGSGTSGGGGGGPVPPPNPDTGVSFRMAATGDTSSNATAKGIQDKMVARSTDMIIYNGDLAYASSMSSWLSMTSPVRSKSMVSFGNHDVGDGDGSQSTINALLNAYSIPKTYYSKIFHNVGLVVMEAGENESVSSSSGSAQYNFVKSALQGFKANPAIEWIFVANHYPIEGPRGAHHPNEDTVRDDYVPLFDTNGVDVIFTSHNHGIWRTKLLKYNSGSPNNPTVVADGPNFSYNRATANHGHVYFGVGAGGKSHYDMGSMPSYVPFMNNTKYGYLSMNFSDNGKTITFKFYDSSDNLLDTATITHA
jgi:hypothetical protein